MPKDQFLEIYAIAKYNEIMVFESLRDNLGEGEEDGKGSDMWKL